MTESVLNAQEFIGDLEAAVDALLSTELSCRIGDIQIEVADNVQAINRQFRVTIPIDSGATTISTPYKLKVFLGGNEAEAHGALDAFTLANPMYFVSQVQFDYSFQAPNQSERVIFAVLYNESLTDGKENWAGASASGTSGGGIADFSWTLLASTADVDPGAGNYGINNADHTLATFLYIDDLSDSGADLSAILETIAFGDLLYIEQISNPNAAILYTVSGIAVDATGYFRIPVVFSSIGSSTLTVGQSCGFNLRRVSDTIPGVIEVDADYTVPANIGGVDVTRNGTDKTIDLPELASNQGRQISVSVADPGVGSVIVDADGTETINGSLTDTLSSQYSSKIYKAFPSEWRIF